MFNPITYELLSAVGWRKTYCVYAIILFCLGTATAATFRQRKQSELDHELLAVKNLRQRTDYEEVSVAALPALSSSSPAAALTGRMKVLLCVVWFAASTFKSIGYYTPLVTLVSHPS